MAEDEKTVQNINSAMKKLSTGDNIKEEMALIVGPNASWEDFLTPAPMCICLLGELMVISTKADFSLENNPPRDGFKLMRWPNSFRASLVQVANSGWKAFNEADNAMDQVRLMTSQVPNHLKETVKILLTGENEDLEDLLPIKLGAIQNIADKCTSLTSAVEEKFIEVIELAGEILESSTSARSTYEDKLKDIQCELAVAKEQKQVAEDRKKVSEEHYKRLQKAAEKAEKDYERAMDSMPGGWSIVGMNTVEGLSNAFTTVLSGVGRLATLGFGASGSGEKSLVEKAASKLYDRNCSTPRQLDEKTMDAYAKVPTLKSYTESLQVLCINDNKLNTNLSAKDESIRHLHAQFKSISKDLGGKGINDVQDHIRTLSDEGIQICLQLKEYIKAMKQDASSDDLVKKITALHEKVLVLQVQATAVLGICPTDSKAPNQSVMPPAQDSSKSAAQQAIQNARFKIEATTAQLDSTKERYDTACEKLNENTEKLGHIIANIKKLDFEKIEFQQIKETLIKGIKALGELREQWTKLVRFFQMMSNIIRCSMSTSLKDFASTAEKTKSRIQATQGYTITHLKKDMIYRQAFEAAKIAYLVHMISGAYVDVSNKYIMSRIAGLGKLLGYDPDKEQHEIRMERNALHDGCSQAQEGIKTCVLEHKREFDMRVESRIKAIQTELTNALPAPSSSEIQSNKRIKEVVQEAMTTAKELVPESTKGLDPDDFC